MEITKQNLKRIADCIWEIPKDFRADMRVPARIFTSEKMLDEIFTDRSLWQLVNVSTLPGIQKNALVMPDVHEGYGFPIGGVAATLWPDGIISPGGIGYDINCGVRLLRSRLFYPEIKTHLEALVQELYREIPSGVGRGGRLKLSSKELDQVLSQGVRWLVKEGYGNKEDLANIESAGALPNADPRAVSFHAKKRGKDQLGTIGAGNHFVEVDLVEEVFDQKIAQIFGLAKDQITVLIHTGSRGLGHQVATDYLRTMVQAMAKYNLSLPDRELAGAPLSSTEGTNYFNAMAAAANFAWSNRQLITWEVRQVWQNLFGSKQELSLLYDVAHNIAKIETHQIDGEQKRVIMHRKGATRAFAPGHPEVPTHYRAVGQPVIIPGSMGTASYVMAGTAKAMELSFGSTCHGAGRRLSRGAAKRQFRSDRLRKELEREGVHIQAGSLAGLTEEAPLAYKDIDQVVAVVDRTGIGKKIARLKPLVVIKG